MGIPQDIEALGEDITALEAQAETLGHRASDLELMAMQLADRIIALEAYVIRNDKRITLIEAFMADHQAGAERRQRQIDMALQEAQRLRWQQRTGRQA